MYFYLMSMLFFTIFVIMTFFMFITIMENKIYMLEYTLMKFNMMMEIKLFLYFDFMSNLFLMIVSIITMVAFYFSKFYMAEDPQKNKFITLTFLFVTSMYIVILSMNMYMIMLGWDGLGITSYLLIIHYQSEMSNYSGMFTILTNRLGDIGIIFSLYFLFDFFSFDLILLNKLMEMENKLIFLLFLLFGSITKSAQFPFSAWLPLAMAAPTPISALVHSSTLVTAGIYLFIRFEFFFKNNFFITNMILLMSGMTMLMSGLMALSELDIKKVIAFSTMSQLSLMMMILLMGLEILSFFHILTHALFKAMLFFCSGVFIHLNLDNQDIRNYTLLMKYNKMISFVFFLGSISLMGFPFLSGWYSKDLILEYTYSNNYNMFFMIMLIILTMVTSMYSMRLIYFSLLMGKMGNFMIYNNYWSKMNNFFIFLIIGVLTSGSMLSWLIMEKLNIIFLKTSIKFMNLILIYLGIGFYTYTNITFINKTLSYFQSMFYLLSVQGTLSKKLFLKSSYLLYMNEFYLEHMFVFKFKNLFNSNYLFKLMNYMFFTNLFLIFLLIFMI